MCVYARACACVYQVPGGALGGLVLVNSAGSFLPDGVHVCVCVCVCLCLCVCMCIFMYTFTYVCMYVYENTTKKKMFLFLSDGMRYLFFFGCPCTRERESACVYSVFICTYESV